MFKIIFIRVIADEIKKTFSVITKARVLLIIETIFISIIKSKQNIIFKNFICYNCDKAGYYKKNCTIQDQIEINKKNLNKVRLHNLHIDDEWKINNVKMKHINDSFFDLRKEYFLLKTR